MGIIKDAIRKVLTEEAQRMGRDIRFIDSPTQVIETPAQAKYNDIRRVERGLQTPKADNGPQASVQTL